MKHRIDAQLREQARVFVLKFACRDCDHFDAPRDRCLHGYTERPNRDDLERPGAELAFCKEFELGAGDDP
jgi:hypothetical protein